MRLEWNSLVAICGLLLVSTRRPAHAGINTWTSNGPGGGGDVLALAIDPAAPETLYAGTEGTCVLKSVNGGTTWGFTAVDACHPNAGLTGGSVVALKIDPTSSRTLYAGTDTGVLKTTDGGSTWNRASNGLPEPDSGTAGVSALAINPGSPSILYAGTQVGAVFKSTDSGTTWSDTGLQAAGGVTTLTIDPSSPDTLYAGIDDFFGGGGLFKSTDGGSTWRSINMGLNSEVDALAIDGTNPTTLYAGGGGGAFTSTDGGSTWRSINTGLNGESVLALAIDPTIPTTLYAATRDDGVFKSTDGGDSWGRTGLAVPFTPNVHALAIDPTSPTTLYAGAADLSLVGPGDVDVFMSADGGSTWGPPAQSPGGGPGFVRALAIDSATPTTLYAGGNGGVFKSTNSGSTWVVSGVFDIVNALAVDPTSPATLYAGTESHGVFKSTNGGSTWDAVNTGLPTHSGVDALAIDPTPPTTIYAATEGVFKSTDGGSTWENTGGGGFALAIDPTSPTTIYAGGVGGVFKSTDRASTWTFANIRLPADAIVISLAIDPTAPTILYAGTRFGEVFKSTDGGINWGALNTGLPVPSPPFGPGSIFALAVAPTTPTTLYAGYGGDPGGRADCSTSNIEEAAATRCGVFAIQQVPVCTGDCRAEDMVTISDLVQGVDIVLGNQPATACPAFENAAGTVDVAQLIKGVRNALHGCGSAAA